MRQKSEWGTIAKVTRRGGDAGESEVIYSTAFSRMKDG